MAVRPIAEVSLPAVCEWVRFGGVVAAHAGISREVQAVVRLGRDDTIQRRGIHLLAGAFQSRDESEKKKAAENERTGSEGHSMVWYRPGLASPSANAELYTRSIINVLDVAVSDSLVRNGGAVGRFNIVMDCAGMSSKNSPSVAGAKRLFSILQDHYPDRLGVLLVANLSGLKHHANEDDAAVRYRGRAR